MVQPQHALPTTTYFVLKNVLLLRFLRYYPAVPFSRIFRGSPAGLPWVGSKAVPNKKCTIIKIFHPQARQVKPIKTHKRGRFSSPFVLFFSNPLIRMLACFAG